MLPQAPSDKGNGPTESEENKVHRKQRAMSVQIALERRKTPFFESLLVLILKD